MHNSQQIPEELYVLIRDLLREKTGIFLNPTKIVMIQSRLSKRMNALGLDNYYEYMKVLKNRQHSDEITHFINALTTNKTEFFRENEHFEILKGLLKESDKAKYYVWSAASSCGAEAYSIAMTFEEMNHFSEKIFDYRILGTDIDTEVIKRAEEGIFKDIEVKNIPPHYVAKYFLRGKGSNSKFFRVNDNLKRNIKFRHHNLVNYNERLPLTFDIIFLRNVLIYFQKDTIQKVLDKILEHLAENGFLFIGHSETLNSIDHDLKVVSNSVYRKVSR